MKISRIPLRSFSFVPVAALALALAAVSPSTQAETAVGSGGRVPQISPVQPPIGQISISSNKATISRSVGQRAKLIVSRGGGDASVALTVNLSITGTAVNGQDYLPVSSTAVIPAGADSVKVKIIALGTGDGGKVKVVVVPGGGYSVSATSKVRVTITD